MKRRSFLGSVLGAIAAVCTPVAAAASSGPFAGGQRIDEDFRRCTKELAAPPIAQWLPEPHRRAYVVPGDYGPGSNVATYMPRQFGERWYVCRATERYEEDFGRLSWVRFEVDRSFWWNKEPVFNR